MGCLFCALFMLLAAAQEPEQPENLEEISGLDTGSDSQGDTEGDIGEPQPAPRMEKSADGLTATCRRVQRALDENAEKAEVKTLLSNARNVTAQDVECLRRQGLPDFAVKKAQSELIKRHGLAALPSGPVVVWAVLLADLRSIAAGTFQGKAGLLMTSLVGRTDIVEQVVERKIVEKAKVGFAEEGVEAHVVLRLRTLQAAQGVHWTEGRRQLYSLRAGSYYVLEIRVPDAVAAARANRGDFLVGIGARLGMDVESEVNKTVRQTVWSKLAEEGVPSVLVPTPR